MAIVNLKTHLIISDMHEEYFVKWTGKLMDVKPLIKNGLPVTKKNADYHGFGMKSIRNIVDRHNGILKIDADKNSFRLQIFFSELS